MNAMKIEATLPLGIAVYPALINPDEYKGTSNYKTGVKLDPESTADWTVTTTVPREKPIVTQGDNVGEFIKVMTKLCEQAFADGKESLTKQIDAATGKAKAGLRSALDDLEMHTPFNPDYDDEGDETGLVVFNTKSKSSGVSTDKSGREKAWQRELPLYDSSGAPIPPLSKSPMRKDMTLWSGSKIIVAVRAMPFCAPGLKKAGLSLQINAVQVIEAVGGGGNRTAGSFGFGIVGGGYVADSFEAATAPTAVTTEDDDEF